MKKRNILLLLVLLLNICHISAQNVISASDVEIPHGGNGTLLINFSFTEEDKYQGYQFTLTLPDGITVVTDAGNASGYDCTKGSCHSPSHTVTINKIENDYGFVCYSGSSTCFVGTSGVLLTLLLHADESIAIGTVGLDGGMSTIKLGYTDVDGEKSELLANANFNISIVEPRILLDEESDVAPISAYNVNVKVKRTINADRWSTICLPFAMSESQVESVFGSDVELADFNGCVSSLDADENVVGISVNFVQSSSIEANHPYIIKVTNNISEFNVDGVDVLPADEPSVDKDPHSVRVGKQTVTFYNSFIGTYKAVTLNVEYALFLNGGAFWYAPSELTLKGYRGYFDFYDVLTSAEQQYSRAPLRAQIYVSLTDIYGETTEIIHPDFIPVSDNRVYSLSGIYMGEEVDIKQLPKGTYILNGKIIKVK